METLQKHLVTCELEVVPCPKKCKTYLGDGLNLMRKEVADHLRDSCANRDHKCEYCGEEGSYSTITQSHDSICAMKMVPCPVAQCKMTVQRQFLDLHVNMECPFTVISCKYKESGCEVKLKRQDMPSHEENSNFHLSMALQTLSVLQKRMSTLENSVQSIVGSELQSIFESIANLKSDLQTSSKSIAQVEDRCRTLKIDEPFVFKLTDYQTKRESNKPFSSLPFYAFPKGYRMSIKVYANGCGQGEGTHLSVFATILEGMYDAELDWPVCGNITFTLLNQAADTGHASTTIALTSSHGALVESEWGFNQFVAHCKLTSEEDGGAQYLVANALYFKVTVSKIPDRKAWLQCTP